MISYGEEAVKDALDVPKTQRVLVLAAFKMVLKRLNVPQQSIREATIEIFVDVPSTRFNSLRVGEDCRWRGGADLGHLLFRQLSHHAHPRHLVAVRTAAYDDAGQGWQREVLHLSKRQDDAAHLLRLGAVSFEQAHDSGCHVLRNQT